MNKKYLIHYGYGHTQINELNLINLFCKEYNLEHIHIPVTKLLQENSKNPFIPFSNLINKIKYSSFSVIWNGMQYYGPLITKLCKEKNIPHCYIEWGMLPQSSNFFIDTLGFCGDSILNHDVSWVKQDDVDYMKFKRSELQSIYEISDQKYILIPLQIENDSQVLYYTKYKNMHDLVIDIINSYPNHKIIIKTHPKDNSAWYKKYVKVFNTDKVSIVDNSLESFMSLAANASTVIGLTSTCLYEAAILGKEIIALGNHPLGNKYLNREKILAGSLVLNLNRKTGDLKKVLDRFSLHPLF